jgi:hypothetical protein
MIDDGSQYCVSGDYSSEPPGRGGVKTVSPKFLEEYFGSKGDISGKELLCAAIAVLGKEEATIENIMRLYEVIIKQLRLFAANGRLRREATNKSGLETITVEQCTIRAERLQELGDSKDGDLLTIFGTYAQGEIELVARHFGQGRTAGDDHSTNDDDDSIDGSGCYVDKQQLLVEYLRFKTDEFSRWRGLSF